MGRGGKGLLGKQAFERLLYSQLIAFDREQIVTALFVEDLSGGFLLRVNGVSQHQLAV